MKLKIRNTKGIDNSQIWNNHEVNNGLICSYCKLLIKNGISCNKCEDLFCKNCIMENNNKCYTCLEKNFENIPKIWKNKWNKINLSCYFKDNGCNFTNNYQNILDHEIICEYLGVNCNNKDCDKLLLKSNLEKHWENCEYKQIECKYCNKFFIKKLLNKHFLECDLVEESCIGCNNLFLRKDLNIHIKVCEYIKLECKSCLKLFLRPEYVKHSKIDCLLNINSTYFNELNMKIYVLKQKIESLYFILEQYYKLCLNYICYYCKKGICYVKYNKCNICFVGSCKDCYNIYFKNCSNCKKPYCNLSIKDNLCKKCILNL